MFAKCKLRSRGSWWVRLGAVVAMCGHACGGQIQSDSEGMGSSPRAAGIGGVGATTPAGLARSGGAAGSLASGGGGRGGSLAIGSLEPEGGNLGASPATGAGGSSTVEIQADQPELGGMGPICPGDLFLGLNPDCPGRPLPVQKVDDCVYQFSGIEYERMLEINVGYLSETGLRTIPGGASAANNDCERYFSDAPAWFVAEGFELAIGLCPCVCADVGSSEVFVYDGGEKCPGEMWMR